MKQQFHHGFGHRIKPCLHPPTTVAVNSTTDVSEINKRHIGTGLSDAQRRATIRYCQCLALFTFLASGFFVIFLIPYCYDSLGYMDKGWDASPHETAIQRVPLSGLFCSGLSLTNRDTVRAAIFSSPQAQLQSSEFFETSQFNFSYLGESWHVSSWLTRGESEATVLVPPCLDEFHYSWTGTVLYVAQGLEQFISLVSDLKSKPVAVEPRSSLDCSAGKQSFTMTIPKTEEDEGEVWYVVLRDYFAQTNTGAHVLLKEKAKSINVLAHCIVSGGDTCVLPSSLVASSHYVTPYELGQKRSGSAHATTGPRVHVECIQHWWTPLVFYGIPYLSLIAVASFYVIYMFGKKIDNVHLRPVRCKVALLGDTVDRPPPPVAPSLGSQVLGFLQCFQPLNRPHLPAVAPTQAKSSMCI